VSLPSRHLLDSLNWESTCSQEEWSGTPSVIPDPVGLVPEPPVSARGNYGRVDDIGNVGRSGFFSI